MHVIVKLACKGPFTYRTEPDGAARKTHKSKTLISIIAFTLRAATYGAVRKNAEIEQCSISAFFCCGIFRQKRNMPQHAARSENAMTEINAFDLCVFTCGVVSIAEVAGQ